MSEEHIYLPRTARLVKAISETETERTIVFELLDGEDLPYTPGQFVTVTVFGSGEAPFALSSASRADGGLQITVRRYPGGRVTEALHALQPGDYIGIRGPFGNGFPLDRLRAGDVLVVAGGIGMAPLRALIETILRERHLYGDLTVLYGARTPDEILFRDLVQEWEHSDEMDLLLTIDRPHPDWDGRVGMVTELFRDITVDPAGTSAVICGPPVMYPFVVAECHEAGLQDDRIFLSLERRMACGVGKCGHCAVDGTYVCLDGPVFTQAQLRELGE
ncbi:MAG: FAD/NAD(P)-binding protein [Armatimonadota bacterium]|nr:FAD/NAD(P)-binding protein [Armatimonadota bacterium]